MQPAFLLERSDGTIVLASENLASLFGLTAQWAPGVNALDFWTRAAAMCVGDGEFGATATTTRTLGRIAVAEPFRLRDGRHIERDCYPQDSAANVVLWIFHDVTHRERSGDRTLARDEHYSLALASTGIGTWSWDLVNDEVELDACSAEMLGYVSAPMRVPLAWMFEQVHPDEREAVMRGAHVNRQGHGMSALPECRVRCRDGSYKWLFVNGSVVRWDEHDRPVLAVGVHVEISRFKLRESALKQSQERLEELFLAMTQGVVMIDNSGAIVDANPVAQTTLGLTLEELTGRRACDPRWDVRGEDGAPLAERDHPAMIALRTGNTVRREISGFNSDASKRIWISCVAIPRVRPDDATPTGAYIIFDDVTERRRTERERAALLDVLSLVNAAENEQELMRAVVLRLRAWTACTAVGIRVKEGEDYPYYVSSGFTEEFVRLENSLCQLDSQGCKVRDEEGRVRYACVCGQVLSGELDYPERYRTPTGSFWLRSVDEFIASTPPEKLPGSLRGRCVRTGYQSVALIPLRVLGETIGLLQLDDVRPNRFERRDIDLLERLASEIALAFAQRRTALALREAEERFRSVVTHAGEGILLVDAEERFEFANPAAEAIFGVATGGLAGRPIRDFFGPTECACILGQGGPQDAPVTLEALICRSDGETRALLLTVAPEINDKAELLRAIVVARDITERKRAEEALRQSEHQLRESQRISQIGSYDFDVVSLSWVSSETLDELFGLHADDPHTSTVWLDLIHPDDRSAMQDYFWHEVIEQGKPFDREYRIVRRTDGAVRWLHGRGALVLDSSGKPSRMIGTISDITERKGFEEQLLEARKMESIGRLAGGIAHDFNNILTVINGYCDLLLASMTDTDPLRLHIAEVRGAGERASELTHQLLAFSRRQMLELRVVNLNELVRQIERWLLRLIGEHVHLDTTLDERLKCVRADAGQMNQVLINLTLNARDAMPQGGWLHVQTQNVDIVEPVSGGPGPGRYVLLTVSDNGVGMTEETRQHLFEPFFTTKSLGSGTGLGLATVYGIVQQCGGWIMVDSEPGQGSTFSIYLPAVDECETPVESVVEAPRATRSTGRILLVEDQPGVRGLALRILTGLGFHVEEAASGEQALEKLSPGTKPFDLLLTDIVMPGMSGRELVDELARRGSKTRVLFMSGYTDDVLVQYGVDHGAGFLQKPFTPEALAAKVRETLNDNG